MLIADLLSRIKSKHRNPKTTTLNYFRLRLKANTPLPGFVIRRLVSAVVFRPGLRRHCRRKQRLAAHRLLTSRIYTARQGCRGSARASSRRKQAGAPGSSAHQNRVAKLATGPSRGIRLQDLLACSEAAIVSEQKNGHTQPGQANHDISSGKPRGPNSRNVVPTNASPAAAIPP